MKISERIKHFKDWVNYIKSKNENDLTKQNKQDLIALEETIKDLELLETLVDKVAKIITREES